MPPSIPAAVIATIDMVCSISDKKHLLYLFCSSYNVDDITCFI
jgi:hypothetical protein